jgi:hypothetical protein
MQRHVVENAAADYGKAYDDSVVKMVGGILRMFAVRKLARVDQESSNGCRCVRAYV